MHKVVFAFLLATLVGCGAASGGGKTVVELKDVPENVMKVAREKLPDVTFDAAWKKPNGVIEVRGKAKNGKVREIDIRPDGSVEEIE
jgi:hypothetical protein